MQSSRIWRGRLLIVASPLVPEPLSARHFFKQRILALPPQMKAGCLSPLLLWLWLCSTSALIASSEKLLDVEAGTFEDAYPSLLAGAEGYWGGILADDVEKGTLREEVWNRLEILGKVSMTGLRSVL